MWNLWKWVAVAAGVVAALAALAALVGAFLPRAHVARRTARLEAGLERAWSLVSAPEGWPRWNPEVTAVRRLDGRRDRPAWRLEGPRAGYAIELVELVPPHRMVTRVVGESSFGGTWTWELVAEGGATRLTLTEHGEVHNLVFRALARWPFDPQATLEAWTRALAVEASRR